MKVSKQKLELAMAAAQLTTTELAFNSGLTPTTICHLRRGGKEAKPTTVGKLARALGVDPVDIVETEV